MAISLYTPRSSAVSRAFGSEPVLDLYHQMNRLFEDTFRGFGAAGDGPLRMPSIDVRETDAELAVSAEVPGVKPADIDVRLEGDVLRIVGEKKNETTAQQRQDYHVMERSYGRFERALRLPFTPRADQVQAQFEDGVLTLRIPKTSADGQRSNRIEIRSGSGNSSNGGKEASPAASASADGQAGAGPQDKR
jgi:HSP20 family protein